MRKLSQWREDARYARVVKRLETQRTAVVVEWADANVWATQEALQGFSATSDKAALLEAQTGAVALLASIDTLLDRADK